MPRMDTPRPERSSLQPNVMNAISVILINRSEIDEEVWVERYGAELRNWIEGDAALRALAERAPLEVADKFDEKLRKERKDFLGIK
jgi:hypothetical protein